MSAQIIFDFRCEPAQIEITIRTRHDKSGFRVSVLGRNLLHGLVWEKSRKDAYASGVTSKEFCCERIHVVVRNRHIGIPECKESVNGSELTSHHRARHSESFHQYAAQFCNHSIKSHNGLTAHRGDRQGKVQAGYAKLAQVRPRPAASQNMLRHKTKSPVLSDQCELEFVVVASTATTMSTLACKSAFRNAARAAQPLRIENPESTALPPNLEFFDLGCAYVGDTLAEWLEGRYSVDNLRKRAGSGAENPPCARKLRHAAFNSFANSCRTRRTSL